MPVSRETLQRIAMDLWAISLTPAEAEAALALLAPAREGLAELDALDLEPLEPAVTFTPITTSGGADRQAD
jgi:hypothetical protein